MPFERPTLSQLKQRIDADFSTNIPDADARLRFSLPAIDATVHAGATHELHGAIAAQEKKLLPIDGDEQTVLKWAEMKGLQRLAATFANGNAIHLNATDASVIAQNVRYQAGNGQVYIVQSDATVTSNQVTVSVKAEASGIQANLAAGSKLTLVSPISGIPAQATVGASGINGGAEQETIPALLDRVLFELRRPPRGGSKNDYIRWAKAAHPGVTRVFVSPHERGPGTVVVRFVTDNAASVIPAPQIVTTVANYILERAPIDARNIFIEAPTPISRDINFTALTPNSVAVQAAINKELKDLFRRVAMPSIRVPDSKIIEAASIAKDEESHAFTSSNTVLGLGDIEVLGAVTWPPVV